MTDQSINIDPQILELLQQFGIKKSLKAHEVLIQAKEECGHIYYVKKGGFLRRFYNDKSSILRTISFHLPSHRPFMTVNENYFANRPSSYEIRAFQSSEVLAFRRDLVTEMSQEYPMLQEFSNDRIMKTLIYENEIKARLISYSSKELYEYLCEFYPELIKQVPSKYIAEFMIISPEWLSKLRQKKA